MTKEEFRLEEARQRRAHWQRWGPYISERAWGTVREDYSPSGAAWEYLTHDHARSRAYRWNEDGIAGICDRHQYVCFAVAMWNGRDPILKERLFGVTGNEGNHGEDVKECYFYLDSTPTHSYMKYLYKYPQSAYPYTQLVEQNRLRGKLCPEFELEETGIFSESRYFDVFVEYAKNDPEDLLVRIAVTNRGPERAEIHLLPTVWFRNRWSWGEEDGARPLLRQVDRSIELEHYYLGKRRLECEGNPELLFTENETNFERLFGSPNRGPYVKDGINEYVVNGVSGAVNPACVGTKAAARYVLSIAPGETQTVRLRMSPPRQDHRVFGPGFDEIFQKRIREADEFYRTVIPADLTPDARNVMRQALGGMLWAKQFYHYVVRDWLRGDPPLTPPAERLNGRNRDWSHLYNADVISMPDKWEFPWYAAWDLAFHCLPLALVDSEFAKQQLLLMTREWYMHPNGQLPAYENAFSDVNPPVHAWAAWRVYKIDKKRHGRGDRAFLARIFQKLLLNFTWWVNRKDSEGRNVFQGGFLGLDNIGVFDRSATLPTGGHLEQADGTGWMAMYCLNLLAIAMELAREDPAYEDVASKFWEHFLYIANAINHLGSDGSDSMWDEADGFFYDVLHMPDGSHKPLKVRSMVGLIPLFAVETLEPRICDKLTGFKRRLEWFVEHRSDLTRNVASMSKPGEGERRLLSIVSGDQLRRVLKVMLDEREFLSPYGIRALSRIHLEQPYIFRSDGVEYRVDYEPGESSTNLFGGNSNWRGPVWFPVNYLLIESLQKFHHYLGDDFKVECPTGSGQMMTLWDVAEELSRRLTRIFLKGPDGRRPVNGSKRLFHEDPHWQDLLLFHEYFHGDNGSGAGASHQTGWTGLVAKLLLQSGERVSDLGKVARELEGVAL
jgi:hypothetical protein